MRGLLLHEEAMGQLEMAVLRFVALPLRLFSSFGLATREPSLVSFGRHFAYGALCG